MNEPLVTALVSTYASERYMAGCLDDLLAQSIGDRLEIVVVDAGSPEHEGEIVRSYQQRHANILYLRTAAREYSSVAFRLGTELARGRYLTVANTDDRHHPEFCARMTAVLEQCPQFGLVYADSRITHVDNETWQHNTATRQYAWPDFTPTTALSCCLFGAQPVWRRSAHEVVGSWDPALLYANDQDMFLRVARHCGAVHLREALGLFLMRPDSQSGSRNRAETLADVMRVMKAQRRQWPLEACFPGLREHDGATARAAACIELGNLCALGPYTDAELALHFYQQALAQPVAAEARKRVREVFANNTGCVLACAGATAQAAHTWALTPPGDRRRHNEAQLALALGAGRWPMLHDLQFEQLAHDVVTDSRRAQGLTLDADLRPVWSAPHEQLPWQHFAGADGVLLTASTLAAVPVAGPMAPPPVRSAATRAAPAHVLLVMFGWAESGGGTMLPRAYSHALAATGTRVSVFYAAVPAEPLLPAYGLQRHQEGEVALYGLCNRPSVFMDLQHPEREIDDAAGRAVFAALLEELQPDLVHFWNLHNLGMSLPAVCRAHAIPTVLSSNNYWAICPRLYLIDERLQRCGGGNADGAKCATCLGGGAASAVAHAERKRAGIRMLREDIDVHLAVSTRVRDLYLANGEDPAHVRVLRQEPPAVAEIWSRVGVRRRVVAELRRPLRVGYLGSVMAHKGLHVLAAALQLLPAGACECVALGDLSADYVQFVRQVDRQGRLHLHGGYAQAMLPDMLAKFDVIVVPSVWDDCAPYVVAEALAARCPVVGSRLGGIPDFVAHGRTGWLFEAGDAVDLARCLLSFRDDPGLLGRMQQWIDAPRGLAAFVADVQAVYAELMPLHAPQCLG